MTSEEVKNIFYNAKTKKECLFNLGINTNKRSGTAIDNDLKNILNNYNINEEDISSLGFKKRYYYNNPSYCKCCGNILSYDKKNQNFCSSHCAVSLNNKLKKSPKEKISEGMINFYNKNDNYILISEALNKNLILNPNNEYYKDSYISLDKLIETKCKCCGKYFKKVLIKNNQLSNAVYCSDKCKHEIEDKKLSLIMKEKFKNGEIKGWQSRNVISYPEKFFIKVLDNNNIPYIREEHFNKKYFLDFYIKINNIKIDLEIDGSQHNFRKEHDKLRDKYLTENGIIVYRIKWNSINNKNGKIKMKEKINKFILFYNSFK